MSEQQPDAPTETDAETDTTGNDTSKGAEEKGTDDQGSEELEASGPDDIGDDKLPEDLQPKEDNPLARHPGQSGNEDDQIGADREEDPETAPLVAEDADYGSGAAG